MGGFFLQADRPAAFVKLHHAITLRIAHLVSKDRRPLGALRGPAHILHHPMPVEDIVPEDQGDVVRADEAVADQKSLGQSLGARLNFVAELYPILAAVAQ